MSGETISTTRRRAELLRLAASTRRLIVRGPTTASWDLWEPMRDNGLVSLDDDGLEEGLALGVTITPLGKRVANLLLMQMERSPTPPHGEEG